MDLVENNKALRGTVADMLKTGNHAALHFA
jgi:hypothetical protein